MLHGGGMAAMVGHHRRKLLSGKLKVMSCESAEQATFVVARYRIPQVGTGGFGVQINMRITCIIFKLLDSYAWLFEHHFLSSSIVVDDVYFKVNGRDAEQHNTTQSNLA